MVAPGTEGFGKETFQREKPVVVPMMLRCKRDAQVVNGKVMMTGKQQLSSNRSPLARETAHLDCIFP